MNKTISLEQQYGASNYSPLPVVLVKGSGIHVWDDAGKRYIDMMSAYSAVSFGHSHPRLVQALREQAQELAIVSRAYYTDKLAPFLERVCQMTGQPKALPMNTGAEAVETALKAARKWAYTVKGVAKDQAEIIVAEGNFHGRTIAIVGMSSENQYREGFGPFAPGFKIIPYGDADALEKTINAQTAAFLVEPIQGEAGIKIPPPGYLKKCQNICKHHNVLLIADEIQTGLGRTGRLLACEHEHVKPDGLILGKALGGGLLPVSMFLAREDVMTIFAPGDHGSTFGGNPLAAAVGLEALKVLEEENLIQQSQVMGDYFLKHLKTIKSPIVREIRGRGLFIGIEVDITQKSARDVCLQLLHKGILSKDTHGTVVRLAPPLTIKQPELDKALSIIESVIDHSKL